MMMDCTTSASTCLLHDGLTSAADLLCATRFSTHEDSVKRRRLIYLTITSTSALHFDNSRSDKVNILPPAK